jgi:hypothetical protein
MYANMTAFGKSPKIIKIVPNIINVNKAVV